MKLRTTLAVIALMFCSMFAVAQRTNPTYHSDAVSNGIAVTVQVVGRSIDMYATSANQDVCVSITVDPDSNHTYNMYNGQLDGKRVTVPVGATVYVGRINSIDQQAAFHLHYFFTATVGGCQ